MSDTSTPWKPLVTVASVIERDGRFLLVEEAIGGKIVLNQPAGHLEPGESLVAAVARETLEETGWRFTPEYLLGVYRWQLPAEDRTYLRFVFGGVLHDAGDALRGALDVGIRGTHWLSHNDLQRQPERLRSGLVLVAIEDYLAGRRYELELLRELQ
ncbi:MAG: NUDIX hydrolase [Thiotrichales bacterium]